MGRKKVDKRNDEVNYKDEKKHQKFVSNVHFLHDIEVINPLTVKYKKYWREMKRRCIEGYWYDGKWMPGNLYFYVNLCKIKLNKDEYSTTKVEARPFLRDLEWEKSYVYAEARGFSGFEKDEDYTCFRTVEEIENLSKDAPYDWKEEFILPPTAIKKDGSLKKFVDPRVYLRKIHSENLGKPLYQNQASNVIDIECRGGGKSYYGANALGSHNFLVDGATDYDEFLKGLNGGERMTSETLVGAIDGKYTKDLLDKIQLGMDTLAGTQIFQGRTFPSPLLKEFTGTWYSGKQFIKARVEKEIGGKWQSIGSGATIYHRTFKDDEHAGNGTRPSLSIIEEVGFFNILKEMLGAMKDTTYNGSVKFGTIYMFGTGGDMEGGSSEAAMEVFNNPKEYDCLAFQDVWEDTGDIGFFVPYQMGLNQFKDKEGNTDFVKADKYVNKKREKLQRGKSKKPYYDEMQNNPIVPSEAFLIKNSNIFPTGELKEHLNWLKSVNETDAFTKGQCGDLIWEQNEDGVTAKLKWKPDLKGALTPTWFKMKKSDDTRGCIQIWEHPQEFNGKVPFGLYIAGTDPYDQDQSVSTASLGSTYIYKTFYTAEGIYEWPVAEYTARPSTAEEHHENVRKLLLYYNATDLYENERNSLKMHFSQKHSLHLLAKQPDILKANEGSKVQRTYGTHMTQQIKDELEIYTRDWLLQDRGDGKLNLHMIYSPALLQELIYYNREGNFDRVIAFMLTICHRLMNHHIKVKEARKEEQKKDAFLSRAFTGGFFK
jgi:hypothetical protein